VFFDTLRVFLFPLFFNLVFEAPIYANKDVYIIRLDNRGLLEIYSTFDSRYAAVYRDR